MITRRRFLTTLAALGGGTAGYARFVEPRWLDVERVSVRLPPGRLATAVRILHLSDFHVSDVVPLSFARRAMEIGLAENPHAVCLTGDFVTGRIADYAAYRSALSRLSERAPVVACLGNHDGGAWSAYRGGYKRTDEIRGLLTDSGVRCLTNSAQTVEAGGQTLQFVGLGDLWAVEFDPAVAFQEVPSRSGSPVIVLVHNPDAKDDLGSHAWDLMLCGHTHGGQIALPLLGTPYAPVRDPRYVMGLHRWRERLIYITRGVGNLHGVRFNCRPEISVLDLVPG